MNGEVVEVEMTAAQITEARAQVAQQKVGLAKDSPEYKALDQQQRDYSESAGLLAASAYGSSHSNAIPLVTDFPDSGKSGQFDMLYTYENDAGEIRILAVEAKGGSSNLGTRTLTDGTVAQQGSAEYTQAIIDNMTTKYDNLIKATDYVPGTIFAEQVDAIGDTLDLIKDYPIDYHVVKQKFSTDNTNLLPEVTIEKYIGGE